MGGEVLPYAGSGDFVCVWGASGVGGAQGVVEETGGFGLSFVVRDVFAVRVGEEACAGAYACTRMGDVEVGLREGRVSVGLGGLFAGYAYGSRSGVGPAWRVGVVVGGAGAVLCVSMFV